LGGPNCVFSLEQAADMPSYNPKVIEPRWQRYWQQHKTFRTPDASDKPKYYLLDMFPYPSGSGLHVGHPEGYTATDILARYKRMRGFNVLHPMGWDAFGLPAEQYAIKTGTHPRITTESNVATFRRQIQMLGFSYDWDREVDTTDPEYVRWTQWIFLQIYDTWYDPEQKRGRPIRELPIPDAVQARGEKAVRAYRDSKRLAYEADVPVNWCAGLGTTLANEEVIDGKSEREGHPVVRMPLRQWLLRITDYADRLLDDLDSLDWPESIKKMQRDWIGRSEGAEVQFTLCPTGGEDPAPGAPTIRVFTTRPDTLFGATYMVLAPEHPLVDSITSPDRRAPVEAYKAEAARKSERERTEETKKKTGVFTGAYAVNPVNRERIPVWVADYVLAGYGTGAIMAVPAHDARDFAFAKQFGLPIRTVVRPPDSWMKRTHSTPEQLAEPYVEDGVAMNSGIFDGLKTPEFKRRITDWLEERGLGAAQINFKLRDWLFSRQRYWGEPFPILHEIDAAGNPTGVIEPLSEDELPLRLPEMEDFKPTGKPEPPLSKAGGWLFVERGGKRCRRETNTMPQWAGSCWYYLRYIDPKNDKIFCDPHKERYWMPVDLYVGGAEHAVLHLLYARFWHKVLFDRGHVHTPEPFQRLVNQGMILVNEYHLSPEAYEANRDVIDRMGLEVLRFKDDDEETCVLRNPSPEQDKFAPLTEEQVVKEKGKTFLAGTRIELNVRADKMSKSRKNVVNPEEVIEDYGADSLRLYEMFMGPLESAKAWGIRGVEGPYRFLDRVWRVFIDDRAEQVRLSAAVQDVTPEPGTLRLLHQTIQRVTEDLEGMRFNTAIAAMMEFNNHLTALAVRPRSVLEPFVLLLSPFAPHLAEELWQALGHAQTLAYEPWPAYDPALTRADEIEVPVQINGKVRLRLSVPADLDAGGLERRVLDDDKVQALVAGKPIRKVVVVPQKLVNVVVG
jgi:leucyl-tRNA synthetase